MPDLAALMPQVSGPGLAVLGAVTLLAGIVYGFAGFGAALIFMPVASAILPVEAAVAAFAVSAAVSLVTVVPRAWAQVDRGAVAVLIASATLSASLGLWILRTTDVTAMRWAVLAVTAVTLAALVSGWRYRAVPTTATRGAVGLATGMVGGATGLLGPVMVLFQLAGRDSVARSRATALVFLTVTSILLLPLMALQGMLTRGAVMLGAMLLVPYGIGTLVGQRLFDPVREVLYRRVAYAMIGAAILLGLPIHG